MTSLLQYQTEATHENRELILWKKNLLVVAPHHAQRIQIQNALAKGTRTWHEEKWLLKDSSEGIKTVERAQGQELDVVIVDYGLMDIGKIKRELDFIYSRNRLNVSITRAKRKCIVVLSDALLSEVYDVFNKSSTENGYTHMRDLLAYAKQHDSLIDITTNECNNEANMMHDDFNNILTSFDTQ